MKPLNGTNKPSRRYHRIDGWRGYSIPALAVAGSSDTGTWSDSPCPTSEVLAEIARFRREVLRPAGVKSRSGFGSSSNVFCGKRWVTVGVADFPRAAQLTVDWLGKNRYETRYLHEADLDKLGYKAVQA